jgi:hypothetical protein
MRGLQLLGLGASARTKFKKLNDEETRRALFIELTPGSVRGRS